MRKILLIAFFALYLVPVLAQSQKDYPNQQSTPTNGLEHFDFSQLFISDSLYLVDITDGERESIPINRPELLGFIGDNFQRFQIHFLSITKNPSNPLEYLVYGMSKTNGKVNQFEGTFTMVKADMPFVDSSTVVFGFVEFEVKLYGNKNEPFSGFYEGKLKTKFFIDISEKDNSETIAYDGFGFNRDGFCNNQFIGSWTSYKTKETKKCNWGEFRIPESGDLDIGAGEFSVSPKYVKNGWENYMNLLNSGDNPEMRKRALLNEKWW